MLNWTADIRYNTLNLKLKHSGNFHFDLQISEVFEDLVKDLFENKKIEVKRDLMAKRTGNIYIEYESRGKPSGISTTEADYYFIFIKDDIFVGIETFELKKLCRRYFNTYRDKKGGDNNTSKGILLPLEDLIKRNGISGKSKR